MRASGNRRILFLSSGGAVYGAPQYVPIDERHPLNPISSYGVTKVAAEQYLRIYEANHGFRVTIVRPSNPYGPGQATSRQVGAVTTFLAAALSGSPVTVWGNGSVVRDYVYISDVVALLLAAAEREAVGTYNCGSGVGVSLAELIGIVEEVTARKLSTTHATARPFDPQAVILDSSSARQVFGWLPKVDLQQGMERTALHIQRLRQTDPATLRI